MRSTTDTLIAAMRILARDIQSGDGVANAAIAAVAVDVGALEALRSAMSKLHAPMSRTEYAAARAGIIEAAYRLLAGGE